MKKKHDKVEEQKLNPEESLIEEAQEETAKEESLSFQKETVDGKKTLEL